MSRDLSGMPPSPSRNSRTGAILGQTILNLLVRARIRSNPSRTSCTDCDNRPPIRFRERRGSVVKTDPSTLKAVRGRGIHSGANSPTKRRARILRKTRLNYGLTLDE